MCVRNVVYPPLGEISKQIFQNYLKSFTNDSLTHPYTVTQIPYIPYSMCAIGRLTMFPLVRLKKVMEDGKTKFSLKHH